MVISDLKNMKTEVCVVGLGYIGLPTAAFFAKSGLNVVGVDVDNDKVETINRGDLPFFEPEFDKLLRTVVEAGTLKAQTEIPAADAFIITVPTPVMEDRSVDESYIIAAAEKVASVLEGGELVVLESTSPPGMTGRMGEYIFSLRPDLTSEPGLSNTVYLAHCPERVLPGNIIKEMPANDRVIGGDTPQAAKKAKELYSSFVVGDLLLTDAKTAEMTKVTENTFRDINIAFANELSLICERVGVDVWELIRLANRHPRVNILQPGPGVGGHCIAVDPWFLVSAAPDEALLIAQARAVNDHKPRYVITEVENLLETEPLVEVALLGLAFKADIDDLRESPALTIADQLSRRNPQTIFNVVEPFVTGLPDLLRDRENVCLMPAEEALLKSGAVVLLVDHQQFCELDRSILDNKHVIDTRGAWRG